MQRSLLVCAAAFLGAIAVAATGGPDNAGYTFVDSDETTGPGHVWLDPVGDDLGLSDEDTGLYALPFEFGFYGSNQTEVFVSDNATLFFLGDATATNAACPTQIAGWSGVAAYWDDLVTDSVEVAVVGQYPTRMLVVSWEGMHPHNVAGEGRAQVWLMESTNELALVLDDIDFQDATYDGGAGAIVGIQESSGTGLTVACGGGLVSGTTTWFSPPYGRADNSDIDLTGVDLHITGASDFDQLGEVIASGDINADAQEDLLVGSGDQDAAWLFFAGSSMSSGTTTSADLGFVGPSNTQFGASVAMGDLNGDGSDEILIGAPLADNAANEAGAVWVISGATVGTTMQVAQHADARIDGPASSTKARAGTTTFVPGDVDGDGYGDLLVGAPREDTRGTDAGAIYLWSGSAGLTTDTDLSVAPQFLGENINDRLGDAVFGQDVDGDGMAELLLGAPQNDAAAIDGGRVYVIAGGSWSGANDVETAARAAIAGTGLLDNLGESLLFSDLDGDTYPELIAGAPDNDDGGTNAGAVYVFEAASTLSGVLVDTDADLIILGSATYQKAGDSLAAVDVDQDGIEDLVIGAPGTSSGTASGGAAWVFRSLPTTGNALVSDADHVLSGTLPGGAAGTGLVGLPNRRGDGFGAVAVGVPFGSTGGLINNGVVSTWTYAPAWLDADGDGLLARSTRGPDCDDSDANVYPGAPEDTGIDGEGYADDGDCDGWIDGAFQVRYRADWWTFDLESLTHRSTTDWFGFENATPGANLENHYNAEGLVLSTGGSVLAAIDVYGSLPLSSLAAKVIPAALNKLTLDFAAPVDGLSFQLLDDTETISLTATDSSGADVLGHPVRVLHIGEDIPGGRFVGITFATAVYSVSLEGPTTDGFGLDNIQIAWAADSDRDEDGYSGNEGDCDDTNTDVNPSATEDMTNGIDDDCDGVVDAGSTTLYTTQADWESALGITVQVIDFEVPDLDVVIGTQYSPVGLTVNNSLVVASDIDGASPVDAQAGKSTYTSSTLNFTEAQPGLAFQLLDGQGTFTIDAWQGSTLRYSTTLTATGNDVAGGELVALAWDMDIDQVVITGPTNDTWGLDDILFSVLGLDDADGDGFTETQGDCNDTDASISPAEVETWYDGVDSNCDGASDYDADYDGYDSTAYSGTDCDDSDSSVNPAAATDACYDGIDQNCDGHSDYDCDSDGYDSDAYGGSDCDDADTAHSPATPEVFYDGVDDNCTPGDDNDADGDGYASSAYGGDDCNDTDSTIHPGASETWYDGWDQDCSGGSDFDADGDGHVSSDYGGDDCEDHHADAFPGAANDTCYDGVDGDCDGWSDYDCDRDTFDSWGHGGDDCNDGDATIYPGAIEVDPLDGIDQDCDGVDEWDEDGDGYRGTTWGGPDCDDADTAIHPGAAETCYDNVDSNCSGHSDADCDEDGHESDALGGTDCNDTDAATYPGAAEICYDAVDQDCAGDADEYDCDQDSFDSDAHGGADCDDSDATVHPGATDPLYDGVDQNCSGGSDYDADSDGWESDAYGGADCNDTDATIHPAATEVFYDGIDSDCDGASDFDADSDGHDSDAHGGGDCNDNNASYYPGAADTCYDGFDNDCDGASDYDCDGDGYNVILHGGTDCDDTDASIHPGAVDAPYDGVDANCDGTGDLDADGDGYDANWYGGDDCDDTDASVNPGATEVFYDGVDANCDGASDFDADQDGYDSDAHGGDDCNDTDSDIHPGGLDILYDGIDQDCNGADAADVDNDGYIGVSAGGDDCDDFDGQVNPGATETWYDGVDTDCDGASDFDADQDGHESSDHGGDDCDDADAAAYPGNTERYYDGRDGNCDGANDFDQDQDGYNHALWGGDDCDDLDPSVHPDMLDGCGAGDENCNGTLDEDCIDTGLDTGLDTGDSGSDTGDSGADTGDSGPDTGQTDTQTGPGETGSDTGWVTYPDIPPQTGTGSSEKDRTGGCGCSSKSGDLESWWIGIVALVLIRRRKYSQNGERIT